MNHLGKDAEDLPDCEKPRLYNSMRELTNLLSPHDTSMGLKGTSYLF